MTFYSDGGGYTLLILAVLVDLYQYPSFTLPCPLPPGMLYFDCDCPLEDFKHRALTKINNRCTS